MLRHLSAGADVNRFVLASLVRLRFRSDSESAIFDHSAASPYSQCCATYRLAPMSTDLSSLRSFVSAFAPTPSQPYSTTPPHRHIHNVAPLIGWRRCQQICPRFARSSPLSLRLRVSHIRPLRRIAIFTVPKTGVRFSSPLFFLYHPRRMSTKTFSSGVKRRLFNKAAPSRLPSRRRAVGDRRCGFRDGRRRVRGGVGFVFIFVHPQLVGQNLQFVNESFDDA